MIPWQDNLLFNPDQLVCDYPENVDCEVMFQNWFPKGLFLWRKIWNVQKSKIYQTIAATEITKSPQIMIVWLEILLLFLFMEETMVYVLECVMLTKNARICNIPYGLIKKHRIYKVSWFAKRDKNHFSFTKLSGYVWFGRTSTESSCFLKSQIDNCHPVTAGECLEGTCFTGFLSSECDDNYSGEDLFDFLLTKCFILRIGWWL